MFIIHSTVLSTINRWMIQDLIGVIGGGRSGYTRVYFNLSTTATATQLQPPLKYIPTAKITSQQLSDNQ